MPTVVGWNCPKIVQLAPGAMLVLLSNGSGLPGPQVVSSPAIPAGTPKSVGFNEIVGEVIPVSGTFPVLVRMEIWNAFVGVVPLVTFPKLKGAGVRLALTMGVTPVPPSSTAPISNPAPCGREFPKKSVFGAPVAVPLSTAGPAVIE